MTRLAALQKLTNEEIDREIAVKVMGWTIKSDEINHYYHASGHYKRHGSDWNPSTDHNDIAAVRAEIERREVKKLFVLRLTEIVYKNVSPSGDCYWSLINATPRQQCEADLLSIE